MLKLVLRHAEPWDNVRCNQQAVLSNDNTSIQRQPAPGASHFTLFACCPTTICNRGSILRDMFLLSSTSLGRPSPHQPVQEVEVERLHPHALPKH
eukprot:5192156-Amphidinium_carterae.1